MAGADDLTGFWTGRYSYDDGLDEPVLFFCNLRDSGGTVTGEISERVSVVSPGELLYSKLSGSRSGSIVSFAKTYDGAGNFAHRVDYAGLLNDSATVISGHWDIEGDGGSFAMSRPAALRDEAEADEQSRIDITLPGRAT